MVARSSSMQPHMVTVGRKNMFAIVIALDAQNTNCVLILLLLLD